MGGTIRSAQNIAQAAEVAGIHGVLVDSRLLLEVPDLLDTQAPVCG
jgi:hypothetical protein